MYAQYSAWGYWYRSMAVTLERIAVVAKDSVLMQGEDSPAARNVAIKAGKGSLALLQHTRYRLIPASPQIRQPTASGVPQAASLFASEGNSLGYLNKGEKWSHLAEAGSARFCHSLVAVCAHAVILLALLRIAQRVVGFAHLLKLGRSLVIALRTNSLGL